MKGDVSETAASGRKVSGKQVLSFLMLAVLVTAVVTGWWIKQYVYATMFESTRLSMAEQQVLNVKMASLCHMVDAGSPVPQYQLSPQPTRLSYPNPIRGKGSQLRYSIH